VQVERHRAVDRDVALELELLADARRQGLHGVLDGAVAQLRGAQRSRSAGFWSSATCRIRSARCLEVGALGDEVGLAVELDHHAVGGDDQAVARGALGTLADVLRALDAQQLDGLLDVAVGLLQGILAVHHPEPVSSRSRFHVGGGVVRHRGSLSSLSGVCPYASEGARRSRRRPRVRADRARHPPVSARGLLGAVELAAAGATGDRGRRLRSRGQAGWPRPSRYRW
jgi:hypothetical protein